MRLQLASNVIKSSEKDSVWSKSILFPSTAWASSSDGSVFIPPQPMHDDIVSQQMVDIIQLMKPPDTIRQACLEHQLNYPKGTSFRFEGYDLSQSSVQKLIEDIIAAGQVNSQPLIIRDSNRKQ